MRLLLVQNSVCVCVYKEPCLLRDWNEAHAFALYTTLQYCFGSERVKRSWYTYSLNASSDRIETNKRLYYNVVVTTNARNILSQIDSIIIIRYNYIFCLVCVYFYLFNFIFFCSHLVWFVYCLCIYDLDLF